MGDFMELVRKRRSVRSYAERPVEREKLEELAEALRLAPSASNQQPWRLIFVDEPRLREEVARSTFSPLVNFNRFATGAPVLAVIVIEKARALNRLGAALKDREFPLIDIGIAAAQLSLRATELGLGGCMLGWFDEGKIRRLLSIPAGKRVGLVLTLGYPANEGPVLEKKRKSLDEVRAYNTYR
jgi:nitroreductase